MCVCVCERERERARERENIRWIDLVGCRKSMNKTPGSVRREFDYLGKGHIIEQDSLSLMKLVLDSYLPLHRSFSKFSDIPYMLRFSFPVIKRQ